jgi:hypothetical protein
MDTTQLDPQATEPATDDPPPDTGPWPDTRRRPWPPWLTYLLEAWIFVAVLFVVAVLVGAAINLVSGLGHTKVNTFTDPLGRDCTQISKGTNLALSCAPKPFEDRLADGLRDASQRAS